MKIEKISSDNKKEKILKTDQKQTYKNEIEKTSLLIENTLNKIFSNELITSDEKKSLNIFYQNTKNKNNKMEKANIELKSLYINLHKFFNLKSQLNTHHLFAYVKKIMGKNFYRIKNYINIIKNLESENFEVKNNYNNNKKVLIHVKKLENKIRELQKNKKNSLLFDTKLITKLIKKKENYIKILIEKRKLDQMKYNSFYIESYFEKSNLLKLINLKHEKNYLKIEKNYDEKTFLTKNKNINEKIKSVKNLNIEKFLKQEKKDFEFLKMLENQILCKKESLGRIEETLKEEEYKNSSFVLKELVDDRRKVNFKIKEIQNQIDDMKMKNEKNKLVFEDLKKNKNKDFKLLEIQIKSEYKLLKSEENNFNKKITDIFEKYDFNLLLKNKHNFFKKSKKIIEEINYFLDFEKNESFNDVFIEESDEEFLNSEIIKQKMNFYHKEKKLEELKKKIEDLKEMNDIYKKKINRKNSKINFLKENENLNKRKIKNEIKNVFSKSFIFDNIDKNIKSFKLNKSIKIIDNSKNKKQDKYIFNLEILNNKIKENKILFESQKTEFIKKINDLKKNKIEKKNLEKKLKKTKYFINKFYKKIDNICFYFKKEKNLKKIFSVLGTINIKIKNILKENNLLKNLKKNLNINNLQKFEEEIKNLKEKNKIQNKIKEEKKKKKI